MHIGDVLETEMDEIKRNEDNSNRQIQAVAQVIDDSILSSYKLWPTNFIAHDLMHNSNQYSHLYTDEEKSLFERRLEMKIDSTNPKMVESFLAMYANPVTNKMKYHNAF
jgi:hypothetical protein